MLRALILLLLLCISALAQGASADDGARPVPVARDGVLDLRDWDFERDGPVGLRGDWHFWWGRLLDPGVPGVEAPPQSVSVPRRWPDIRVDGAPLPGEGFGTYRLRVLLPANVPPLALRNSIRFTAWDVHVNGRRVVTAGRVGKDAATTTTAGQQPIGAVPTASELNIVVHTAAFGGYGGMTRPLLLAEANGLFAEWQHGFALMAAFLAVCGVIGVMYAILYSLHRRHREYLAFAVMSAGIVLFHLTANAPLGLTLFGWAPGQLVGQANSWIYPVIWIPAVIGGWLLFPTGVRFVWLVPALVLVMLVPVASLLNPVVPDLLRATLLLALGAVMATLLAIAVRAAMALMPWAAALGVAWLVLGGANAALALGAASVEVMAAGFTLILIVLAVMLFDRMGRDVRAVEDLNIRLADANADLERQVGERTRHLSRALEDLETAKDQLVERERLASLGQLVAGVAHELNTPIGIALTTATHLHGCLDDLEQDFAAGRISRTALSDFITDARESAYILTVNINRTAAVVESFKQVAADQTADGRRRFDLGEYLADVAMGFHIPRERVRIVLDVAPGLEMDSFPGALAQAVGELAANAGDHAFARGRKGHLRIEARRLNPETLAVCVEDDGAGVPADVRGRVFDPFVTGARSDGYTGLGLHMVHNLVTGPLGGRIDVEERPGGGTRFVMVLPVTAPGAAAADRADTAMERIA